MSTVERNVLVHASVPFFSLMKPRIIVVFDITSISCVNGPFLLGNENWSREVLARPLAF